MKILIALGIALIAFILLCMVSLLYDYHLFVVRKYRVSSRKAGQRVVLVFISDLHNKVYGERNEDIYSAIRKAAPDYILIGGDMTIAKPAIHKAFAGDLSGMDEAAAFLSGLPEIAPTYFVNGNHEQRIYETGYKEEDTDHAAVKEVIAHFYARLEELGIHQLHNSREQIRANITLHGYEHACEHYEKLFSNPIPEGDVMDKLGMPDTGRFNILLAHNPKFFRTYAKWGADLVLSGHVHGGLMRIGRLGMIGPDLHLFPRYSGGSYFAAKETGNAVTPLRDGPLPVDTSEMVLTCGLGAHTLPIRIFNPGEISVIEILPEGSV